MHIEHPLAIVYYRAPELLEGQKAALGPIWLGADIWAMGIMMCQEAGFAFFNHHSERRLLGALREMFQGRKAKWASVARLVGKRWRRLLGSAPRLGSRGSPRREGQPRASVSRVWPCAGMVLAAACLPSLAAEADTCGL